MPKDRHDNPYASPASSHHPAKPTPRQALHPWGIVSFALAFGWAVGAVSNCVRPMIKGPVHYEAFVALILLAAFLLIASLVCSRLLHSLRWAALTVVATWFSFFGGWSMMSQGIWDDMVFVSVIGALISLAVALPVVYATSRMH